jgi:hypothetical protein
MSSRHWRPLAAPAWKGEALGKVVVTWRQHSLGLVALTEPSFVGSLVRRRSVLAHRSLL